jgi:hypothetical protein
MSMVLNRTIDALFDQRLMRYRHLIGLLLFVASYLLFRIALLLPGLRG